MLYQWWHNILVSSVTDWICMVIKRVSNANPEDTLEGAATVHSMDTCMYIM